MVICYPLDILIGTGLVAKWLRPLMIIAITAVLYVIVVITLNKRFPSLYRRIKRLIPVAAFNNLVIGIAIIINHQFAVSFLGAVGLSLGTCAGFLLLSWLSTEGIERLDNPTSQSLQGPALDTDLPWDFIPCLNGFFGKRFNLAVNGIIPHNNILQYCSSFNREKGGWINVLQEG